MSFTSILRAGLVAVAFAFPAFAGEGIEIHDPYARSSNPKAGAAFMMIHNFGAQDDRLIAVTSDVAALSMLHTHVEDENGVMKMVHVEDGFALPAGGVIALQRGGHHVMFMGLVSPFAQGDEISVTLVFENAGEIELMIPVDQDRQTGHGTGHGEDDSHSHNNE